MTENNSFRREYEIAHSPVLRFQRNLKQLKEFAFPKWKNVKANWELERNTIDTFKRGIVGISTMFIGSVVAPPIVPVAGIYGAISLARGLLMGAELRKRGEEN